VGRPLVGLRMDDILRGVDLLRERNLLYGGTCLGFGKGSSAVDLLHAAVIDPRIGELALEGMLVSYESVAQSPIHRRVFDVVLPGILTEYDLADLAASVVPRPVHIVNAVSPVGNPVRLTEIRTAYKSGNATAGLRREDEAIAAAYPELR